MKLLPNKIQRDILKRHIGPFAFCFFTVMFLLLMQFLILHIHRLIGKGLPLSVIIELILTNLAYMVVLAAPMAVLVASLMAFGKFTERNELTALRAAGINPIHTINPVLAAATILALTLVWFSNDVLPDSNQRARSLFLDIRTKKPGFDLKENEFYDGIDGYTFLVKNITNESDSLYNVTLFQDASSTQDEAIIKAQRGHLESTNQTMTLYLYNGTVLRELNRVEGSKRTKVLEETAFKRHRISFDLSEMAFSRSNPDQHRRNDRTMDIKAMRAVVDSLSGDIQKEKSQIYHKNSFETPSKTDEVANSQVEIITSNNDTTSPYPSRFTVLAATNSQTEQLEIQRNALQQLRDYQSSYESLVVNASWRTNRIAKYWVEIHKKISLPLACIVFVLIGAPIGMYTKKGNLGFAAVISTGFLTFFWITVIQGEKLADRLVISPFTGMWFSNILLALIGGIMVIHLCTNFKLPKLWKVRD